MKSLIDTNPSNNGALPNPSESFRSIPKGSEAFRTAPQGAERFGKMPQNSERTEHHVLTVREASRMFESAGVARTERSIINWCQPNAMGVARLNAFYDPNERRYLITPQSVELAIKEEQSREAARRSPVDENGRGGSTGASEDAASSPEGRSKIRALEQEVMDLKILNRGKDYLIDELRKEREAFVLERRDYVERLITATRRTGELEAHLRLQGDGTKANPLVGEAKGSVSGGI